MHFCLLSFPFLLFSFFPESSAVHSHCSSNRYGRKSQLWSLKHGHSHHHSDRCEWQPPWVHHQHCEYPHTSRVMHGQKGFNSWLLMSPGWLGGTLMDNWNKDFQGRERKKEKTDSWTSKTVWWPIWPRHWRSWNNVANSPCLIAPKRMLFFHSNWL